MGFGKAVAPSNEDKCLICYGSHTPAHPAKRDEKGIPFELKNLKDIFMKILGIKFLPHFSKYGSIYMCYNCHDEFLKVEKIYDEAEHGSEENNHNFDAVREQFAFIVVESIMKSGYISNYVHGNAFDALRYLVFKEWSGKFRKQEELKKGKHPGRVISSKVEIAITSPTTPMATTTKAAANDTSNKVEVQKGVNVPKPLPPPAAMPLQKRVATPNSQTKSATAVTVRNQDKNDQAPAVKTVETVPVVSPPNAKVKPVSQNEQIKQVPKPSEGIKSNSTDDSEKTTIEKQESVSDRKNGKSSPISASATITTAATVTVSPSVANGNSTPKDESSLPSNLDLVSPSPVSSRVQPELAPAANKTEDSVLKSVPESKLKQVEPARKEAKPGPEKEPIAPEKPQAPPVAPETASPDDLTTEPRSESQNSSLTLPNSNSKPEELAKSLNVNKAPGSVLHATSKVRISNPVDPNTPAPQSTYILSADGQQLLSKSGKLQQNHKLIFVRRDPKTGKMIQVPKPNFDMVRGKLNGKEVIVRTAPSSNLPNLNKPAIPIIPDKSNSTSSPGPLAGHKMALTTTVTATTTSIAGTVSNSVNANTNLSSPLTPKIIAVQSVRPAEFSATRRSEIKTASEVCADAKAPNNQDFSEKQQTKGRGKDNETDDDTTPVENFGLEISEATEGDPDREPPLLQQQQLLEKSQPHSKSPRRSFSDESIPLHLPEAEIRSVRSGRRIKRVYDSSSSWASGIEMDELVNQCVKDGRTDRFVSPGKKAKYEVHRHGNLIIEPAEDPIERSTSPSPPILDRNDESLEPGIENHGDEF